MIPIPTSRRTARHDALPPSHGDRHETELHDVG
jgi:hypothetical protein